jgi:hypothetical protein
MNKLPVASERVDSGSAALAAALLCALALSGCSSRLGSQDGGSKGAPGPQVVATSIGNKPTSAAGADPVAITVRSGADVLLSGKDSQSGAAPLTDFAWTQATSDTPRVNLIYRTSNTVDFTAPTVASQTVLNLTLTISDANNKSGVAHVAVTVIPASDPDQFLTTPVTQPPQRTFQVAVVPLNGFANLQADAPVCITLDRTVHYTNRTGQTASVTLARSAHDQIDSTWFKVSGGVAAVAATAGPPDVTAGVASYTNPRATFYVPSFNDDDLFVLFNQPQSPYRPPASEPASAISARVAQQLVPGDIDSASVTITVEAIPGTCASPAPEDSTNPLIVSLLVGVGTTDPQATADPANPPADPANPAGLAPPGSLALSLDQLRADVNGTAVFTETSTTAALYYQTIDPIGSVPHSSQTMNAWLDANCFNSSAPNYAADTHADYTNNFDLGFGRDMYFVTCTASNISSTAAAAGRVPGDSASIVINYPSLESTVLKQNPIVAVAMSHNRYSANGPLLNRITKFFAFAPDDRDGNFYLVRSVNFDHRGQKQLPGACTVCHGGTVKDSTIAPTGDIDSAFMPWDESSLLFSDTDPSFTGVNAPKSGYTEAEQTAAIYALNQHAYATFLNSDPAQAARYAAPEALMQKWYGGGVASPTPSNSGAFTFSDIQFNSKKFDDSGFPLSAVDPSATWMGENAAHGDDIYHTVFAHQCRACHTQIDTTLAAGAGGQTVSTLPAADRFDTYADFMGEYANGPHSIQNFVLNETLMPLARLSTDRMWVNFAGGPSPATILAARVQADASLSGLLDANGKAVPPGTPLISTFAQAAPSGPIQTLLPGTVNALTRFNQLRADASGSYFVANYDWTLCLIPATGPGAGGLDSTGSCSPIDGPVSGTSAVPAFGTTQAGIYQLTLGGGTTSTAGQALATPDTYSFTVVRTDPQAPSCSLSVTSGMTSSMGLGHCASLSNSVVVQGDDLPNTNDVLSVGTWSSPLLGYVASCDLGSVVSSCNGPTQTIYFTNLTAVGTSTLTYQLCDTADNACATGTITVTVTAAPVPPTASSMTYYAYVPLEPSAMNGAPASNLPQVSQTQIPAGGTVLIPINAATCTSSSPGATPTLTPLGATATTAVSLVYSYTVAPCTDPFTMAFTGLVTTTASNVTLPTGGPLGFTTVPLSNSISVALTSPQTPTCNYAGTADSATGGSCTPVASVNYAVTDVASTPTSSGSAALSVKFVETQSWGDTGVAQGSIYGYLGSSANTCQGCHATGGLGAGYWNLAAGAPSALLTLTNSTTVCGTGTACVKPGDPDHSDLALFACNTVHSTNTTFFSGQQCANLRQWIEEGASPY